MRILTGKHRRQWEEMVSMLSRLQEKSVHLESLVSVYKTSNDQFEKKADFEKARADRAVDALLAVRGFPTVTPPRDGMPEIPDALQEDPEKVAAVEARMQRGDASVFSERF